MNEYAAFVGHQPHVSLAELAASVPGFSKKRLTDKNILIFQSPAELNQDFLNNLGGTLLIAKRIVRQSLTIENIPQLITNELQSLKGKVTFSLRTAGLSKKLVSRLYFDCKNKAKENCGSVRYVGSAAKAVIPIVLHEEKIVGKEIKGVELTIIRDREELWIGKTIAAQDTVAYTKRDIEKPVRDTETGLLPPKLAQVMLNLGLYLLKEEKKKSGKITVYDPFCGTGVILLECLLRKYNVLASDIEKEAVKACEKNLEWLRKEEKILKKDASADVFKHDAREPFDVKLKPDLIVTETSLGPALKRMPVINKVEKIKKDNEKLQQKFLQNAAASYPGVPIVCAWPVWICENGRYALEETWEKLPEIGYQPVLPEETEQKEGQRTSLVYRRPDQKVGREIICLRPQ